LEGWREKARILSWQAQNTYPTHQVRSELQLAGAGDVLGIPPGGTKMTDYLLWFGMLVVMTWHDCKRWGYTLRDSLLCNLIFLVLLAWFIHALIALSNS
jgi:hypothetical protein